MYRYKKKYIKYKQKYLALKKSNQTGGNNNQIIIPSHYYKNIIVQQHMKDTINIMIFETENNGYQSMYDHEDIEMIYLNYLHPLITFIHYISLRKILFIGLGGGHIPMLIGQKFPECYIDVVEIDDAVLKAAEKMGFQQSQKTNIHIMDGQKFIQNNHSIYDAIILDLNDSPFIDHANFELLVKSIDSSGLLVINYLGSSQKIIEKVKPYFCCMKIYNCENIQFVCICSKQNRYHIFNSDIHFADILFSNMKQLKYAKDSILYTNSLSSKTICFASS